MTTVQQAYAIFRGGFRSDAFVPPHWEALEPWIHDAISVAYLQGRHHVPDESKYYDFTLFDILMDRLQQWRNDDHEDDITLCRSHVIEIIEGVKVLRQK